VTEVYWPMADGMADLVTAYYVGCSAGAAISLYLAAFFAVTFFLRKTAV